MYRVKWSLAGVFILWCLGLVMPAGGLYNNMAEKFALGPEMARLEGMTDGLTDVLELSAKEEEEPSEVEAEEVEVPGNADIPDEISEEDEEDLAAETDGEDILGVLEEAPDTIERENKNVLPPNEIGQIMIIMYHSIVSANPSNQLERTEEEFYNDLLRLYQDGYRIVSLEDVVNNNITLAAGYSPVVLTFDDGWSSAFSLVEEEETGALVPRPGCAVDIINRFAEEYPDFGRGAVFYVNGYTSPFAGAGTLEERFQYLLDNGYELGNHTYSHKSLTKLSERGVQEEMMWLEGMVRSVLPEYQMLTMAYPYGQRPVAGLRHLALSGEVDGWRYEYKWALREGPSGAVAAPNHVGFDPVNVPRVRATNNASMDLWWYLDYYIENPEFRYISDGDPDVISVPMAFADSVNMDSLGDKALNLYGGVVVQDDSGVH